ncbi:MAG: type II toxin-antitoxin system death-on-curing family toxin [Anaerolineae bacterium]|nr:type II toxin-antitoxin system death-on-curing family toxin [Anaerolineae bacterium]NIN99671.1 type II toxin-antitoxin system death-on-curing family toxin [Anaerolineae bacterium]NIQ82524.1 type II toxin-antitoxin system death-on-curing family toxin [Anaerolineae bacterium]
MTYLTVEQVLFLHGRLIEETGGSHGVRDIGLLQSAVARPQATFEGEELHTDVFSKAAALMESLVGSHPFVDGNKRTGVVAAAIFLIRNGWTLEVSNPELEDLALRVAGGELGVAETAQWLRQHSRRGQE